MATKREGRELTRRAMEQMGSEPDWLDWTRELQAIAQTGRTFVLKPYDRERYEMQRSLASRIMASHSGTSVERIGTLFEGEAGYATPKVDVRGAAFDEIGQLLRGREIAPSGYFFAIGQSAGFASLESDKQ